jgi:hypothetical protein
MGELIDVIMQYRIATIGGKLRGGKTSLAVLIAYYMLRGGLVRGCVTNFPCILPAWVGEGSDDARQNERVMIYDEAWQSFDARTSMTNDRTAGGFIGKWGGILLYPSVNTLDRRLRQVHIIVMRRNLFKPNLVTYQYTTSGDVFTQETHEVTVNIAEAFGMYSTAYVPVGDHGIHARFMLSYYSETGVFWNISKDKRRQTMEAMGLSIDR